TDIDANRVEPGPDTVVDAEEPAKVNVAVDTDLDFVEPDPELGRPDAISDRLTRTQCRQGVLDRVRRCVAAPQRFGLIDGELVSRTNFDGNLAWTDQVVVRLELGLRLSGVR